MPVASNYGEPSSHDKRNKTRQHMHGHYHVYNGERVLEMRNQSCAWGAQDAMFSSTHILQALPHGSGTLWLPGANRLVPSCYVAQLSSQTPGVVFHACGVGWVRTQAHQRHPCSGRAGVSHCSPLLEKRLKVQKRLTLDPTVAFDSFCGPPNGTASFL